MVIINNSNGQFLDVNSLNSINYSLIACSKNHKRYYYRVENSPQSCIARIKILVIFLFKTIITCGLAPVFSDYLRSKGREGLWNHKEIVITSQQSLKGLNCASTYDKEGLANFLTRANRPQKIADVKTVQDLDAFLTNLPEKARGDLRLLNLNYKNFEQLPNNIADLVNLKKLVLAFNKFKVFPKAIDKLINLEVLSFLNNQLISIPTSIENLIHLKDLSLISNQLEYLPSTIGNLFNLEKLFLNCNLLDEIPTSIGNLACLTYFDLTGNLLDTLPDDIAKLSQLKYLFLNNNLFQTVPNCLYLLPKTCTVYLENNNLSIEAINELNTRIQEKDYPGPSFQFFASEKTESQDETTQNLKNFLNEWGDVSCQTVLLRRLSISQKEMLLSWLKRLKYTADYKNHQTVIKDKVNLILEWFIKEKTKVNLKLAYQIITDAISSCGDRVALSVNVLSMHIKLCQCHQLNLIELKELIIGLERINKLHKIAEKKCLQMQAKADPIEVYLYYEIQLKDALYLPIEITSMEFEKLAFVSNEELEQAKNQILIETNLDQQATLLLQHSHWKEALTKHLDFEKIKEKCKQQKDEALNQISSLDNQAIENYYPKFKRNDETIWDPYYLLTQQIIQSKEI